MRPVTLVLCLVPVEICGTRHVVNVTIGACNISMAVVRVGVVAVCFVFAEIAYVEQNKNNAF